jgi:hypothetical protein
MAEIVSEFPERNSKHDRYPWERWLDGSVWKLTPGKDFERIDSFKSALAKAAKIRSVRAKTTCRDNHLFLQAVKL